MYNNYSNEGVFIRTNVLSGNDTGTLIYDGILSHSGADDIYVHFGYGDNHNWQNTSYIKMTKTKNGFETSIPLNPVLNTNITFKDSANNWDNNSGHNYVFT